MNDIQELRDKCARNPYCVFSPDEVRPLLDEIEALRKAWTEAESDNNNLRAEIEKTRAEPVRKVEFPQRHWHHDVGHFYDSEEVIASLKSANVEFES